MVRNKKEKGITLIAVVVTVIVLLILAAISIGALKGDNGILTQSKSAKEDSEISEEKSILNVSIAEAMGKNTVGNVDGKNLEDALKKHVGEGKYTLTSNEDSFIVEFTKSRRKYIIDKDGNIEEYIGRVAIVVTDKTTERIEIRVTSESEKGISASPEYKYYIKESSEKEYPSEPNCTSTNSEYTFTGLITNTSYDIKVTTIDNEGNTIKGEITEKTEGIQIPDGEVDGAIAFGMPTWSGGKASITISTNTDYTIQYQKNSISGAWNTIASGETVDNLSHGYMVYARLTDGINYGDYASVTITDSIGPIVNVTTSNTTKSITANVTATDNETGMPTSPEYKYYIKKSTESSYPSTATYTGTNTSYTFDNLIQNTNYDIKVTTTDNAGNIGQGTALNKTTETVPSGLESGAIVFGTPTWSGGKASVTISTTQTGYTIEYQTNSVEGTWTTIASGGTVSNLSNGDTVYARLTDGVNNGEYASVTISDGVSPTISSFTLSSYDTSSIAVNVSAVDNETGIANYQYQYKKSTETTYTIATTSTSTTYTYTGLTDGTTYNLRVIVIDNAGNSSTKDLTQATVVANHAPEFTTQGYADSKTTSSITIRAIATDADGDTLTYKLYTGTSSSSLSLASTSSATSSGTAVSLSKSSLGEYTTYYFRMDVTDGKETTTGTVSSVRTYCSGTTNYCSDGSSKSVKCSTCGGTGTIVSSDGCSGEPYDTEWQFFCGAGCNNFLISPGKYCDECGWGYREGITCDNCGYYNPPVDFGEHNSSSTTCSDCSGSGYIDSVTYCSHGYTSSHYYCSHGHTSQHD